MAEQKEQKLTMVKWIREARLQDITYHRVRQQIWGKLCKLIKDGTKIEKELFRSLKSALTCRSQDMDDNKKLAFETALDELEEVFVDGEEEEEEDEMRSLGVAAPKSEE